ncbi:MAG: ABC transporter [Rhodospirillum sp.]|jgi:phospholipid/cholesterol/gamma-HCH transport system permease protein|nr:ABC transporter [Rhodospirillum sp.]
MTAVLKFFDAIGRRTARGFDEWGFGASLLAESIVWIFIGRFYRQPVRFTHTFAEMMRFGIAALPIAILLSATIGLMLAIQSLYSLGLFGAQNFAYIGIALSVTREFSPLIMGILIAGRSGSAIAARLATMTINQEIDALQVMGINPVRFLVAPMLIALVVMLPCLAMLANLVSIFAAGLYVSFELDKSFGSYIYETLNILRADDVLHGITKSSFFGLLIGLIGVMNGAGVSGGAEGVGRVTTRAVVQAITAIVVSDMVIVYLSTH